MPVLRRARGPDAARDARALGRGRRRTARLAGARRPEPLSRVRAAGGRRPRAARTRARWRSWTTDVLELVAEAWRRARGAPRAGPAAPARARQRGPRRGREPRRTRTRSSSGSRRSRPSGGRARRPCRRLRALERERREGSRRRRAGRRRRCSARGPAALPYELLIAPRRARGGRLRERPARRGARARSPKACAGCARSRAPRRANAWLHDGAHWHVELLPRLTVLAGLELGAGVYVNPLPPEQAAAALRRAG